uniref:Head to tail adaptor n=1 Tax=Siphoviridae sp. ctvok7 TaxID=2827596 RepID=A0A8S5LL63_9CAUD|nr:MAG TPA: head to tail adaptor [Siphoviridae sp. ctvok7]
MFYWGKPQFFGVRAAAANIGWGKGSYTVEQFQQDYPQFFNAEGNFLGSLPMLEQIIDMANTAVQPDKWLDSWRYAVGLYVAHYVTLSLRGYAASNETPEQAAASGALVGMVKSATLGDASVTYDTAAITAGTEDWGDLNSTTYGQMFANRAKLIGLAGTYII